MFAGPKSGTKLSVHSKLIQVSEVEEGLRVLNLSICYSKWQVCSGNISFKAISVSTVSEGNAARFEAPVLARRSYLSYTRLYISYWWNIRRLLIFPGTSLTAFKDKNKLFHKVLRTWTAVIIYSAAVTLDSSSESNSYSDVVYIYMETKDTWTWAKGSKPVSLWLLFHRSDTLCF